MSAQASLPSVRLMFGGDVMLGRIVKDAILRFGPGYPLQPIADMMHAADLTVVNLECAITSRIDHWPGAPKAFYFGAPPQAVNTLFNAGVDLVSLANNHALDFGIAGLLDTLRYLHERGIRQAGAGADIDAALMPAILKCRGMSFGMAAFCDHQEDFAAQHECAGIAFLDLDDEQTAVGKLRTALQPLLDARVDWPILSLHWGPNMVWRPSDRFRRIAHAAIEMGWKILFGHSAHIFHGIEIVRGCPILYAAGDLVDDYRVDADFRNDHQMLFSLELTRDAVRRIDLHPIFIDQCQARPASPKQFAWITAQMRSLCAELGTQVEKNNDKLWIDVSSLTPATDPAANAGFP